MFAPLPARLRPRHGFSILELLVVVAVVGLLSALSVASLGVIATSRITTAALDIRGAAALARQKAMTVGAPVELRFFKAIGLPDGYSAFQMVSFQGTNQIKFKLTRLPEGILIIDSETASSLLYHAPTTNDAVPGFLANETRVARFLPDGSMAGLPTSGPLTLSIAKATDPEVANGLPANFATVSFDAVLGATAIYRP